MSRHSFRSAAGSMRTFCVSIGPSKWPHWVAVELEAPTKQIFTKMGRRTAALEHALQQIRDWREFVRNNLDFVNRSPDKSGLGLEYADSDMIGHVYIGRRPHSDSDLDKLNTLRRQIEKADRIRVYTWDGFVEWAEKRAGFFGSMAGGMRIDLGKGEVIELRPTKDKKL
ncbi:MAG: Shedu anti-phage system protein SduA domain-containing protein [Mesorhizobium sp.]